jgi:hypothetical protein
MAWHFVDDPEELAARAGELLARDPVRHTLSLTALADARARPSGPGAGARYGWWTDAGGEVAGAALQHPPFDLVVDAVPDRAVGPLVEGLAGAGPAPGGVVGPTTTAAHFAALWARQTGAVAVVRHAQRLFRLESLVDPVPPPPGRARPATDHDVALVAEWTLAFGREAGTPTVDPERWVRQRVASGAVTIWSDRTGRPVSLASRSGVVAGMARVGPVYTPPPHRAHGYAAGATAAASRAALAAGARDVVLFTDLANRTANALYPRLGYLAVEDRLELELRPPA